jgi:opacity protein-like surface antigen
LKHAARWVAAILATAAPAAIAQVQPPAYPPPPGYPPSAYPAEASPRSQVFDLTAFAGYQLNGDVGTSAGSLNIGDSPSFGAALDYRVHPLATAELIWIYTKPDANFVSINGAFPSSRAFGVASHYFQIGGMHVRHFGPAEPFLGFTLGAALYLPEAIPLNNGGTVNASDTWRFATTFMLGTKLWITPNIGVRLETRMLMPIVINGGGFYAGTGGSGMSVSGGIPSLQFGFTGGLVFGK